MCQVQVLAGGNKGGHCWENDSRCFCLRCFLTDEPWTCNRIYLLGSCAACTESHGTNENIWGGTYTIYTCWHWWVTTVNFSFCLGYRLYPKLCTCLKQMYTKTYGQSTVCDRTWVVAVITSDWLKLVPLNDDTNSQRCVVRSLGESGDEMSECTGLDCIPWLNAGNMLSSMSLIVGISICFGHLMSKLSFQKPSSQSFKESQFVFLMRCEVFVQPEYRAQVSIYLNGITCVNIYLKFWASALAP